MQFDSSTSYTSSLDPRDSCFKVVDIDIMRGLRAAEGSQDESCSSFASSISSLLDEVHGMDINLMVPSMIHFENEMECSNNNDGETKQDSQIDDATEDAAARIISSYLGTHDRNLVLSQSGNINSLLLERASLIQSITWLGRHVPSCVMQDVIKEVSHIYKREESRLIMPHAQIYKAALLFIDMSGFTQLSLLLDLESLSKVCMFYDEINDKTFIRAPVYLVLINHS